LSDELGLDQIGFFAYQKTYGSNRDLPNVCYDLEAFDLEACVVASGAVMVRLLLLYKN
jgi:hypothetical protein